MLELYHAKLVHIEALSKTSLFSDIELNILQKIAATLKKVLKIQEQDITSRDILNRVIQSSRNLYIGNQGTPISDGNKSSLSGFLMNVFSGNELHTFTITETKTNKRRVSVNLKQKNLEFAFDFTLIKKQTHIFDTNNYELSISKIDVEQLTGGWTMEHRTLMLECSIGHYWTTGEVIRYLRSIHEQGLRVDGESWMGSEFTQDESVQIIFELVLHNLSIEEEELIDLRRYTYEILNPTSFNGVPDTFNEAVTCLSKLTSYLTSIYEDSLDGFDFGELIAIGFLITSLEMSENDKHIGNIANALFVGLSQELEMKDIKAKVSEHIEQSNIDYELFGTYDDLEAKVEKLYTYIDELVTEYDDE